MWKQNYHVHKLCKTCIIDILSKDKLLKVDLIELFTRMEVRQLCVCDDLSLNDSNAHPI